MKDKHSQGIEMMEAEGGLSSKRTLRLSNCVGAQLTLQEGL